MTAQLWNSNSNSAPILATPARSGGGSTCSGPGARGIETFFSGPVPCHTVSFHFLSPVPLEALSISGLGCLWPWRLLRGTPYYWPVPCFVFGFLVFFPPGLAPVFLYCPESAPVKRPDYPSKVPEELGFSPQISCIFCMLPEPWRGDDGVSPSEIFLPVISWERAQARGEGQGGKMEKKKK